MRSIFQMGMALVAAVMLAACDGRKNPVSPTPPSTPVLRIVVGRVLDVQANRGIPGTSLVWDVLEGSRSTTRVVTDDAGIYVVQVPPADRYVVSINEAVFVATVRLASDIRSTDFLRNTGGCSVRYGIIIDAVTRQPVSGARVSWAGFQTLSNADGSYRLNLECRPPLGYGFGTSLFSVTHQSYNTWGQPDARAETLGRPGERRDDVALTPR